ncbi:TonB-dependent receptor domain-containing protein [Pseudomonas typographi]|uniref:TonB-dependent receptor n=1 Tax=Pseudomonas typographi TaxID=2715964 RepID=A0ABR7Z2V4_9PSED|nr:TonB-dependent receptor [Pseudomonas typographi]MBD1599747.1 TonB-dependent receptor [Pseudomonas typographi]
MQAQGQAQTIDSSSDDAQPFDIAAGPLDRTLLGISRQTGVPISFQQSLVDGHQAPAIHGTLSREQALTLALQGSGLEGTRNGQAVVLSAGQSVSNPTRSANAADVLPEVVVTAERRETNLQTTPVSVGVIGAEALQRSAVTVGRDLNAATAGLLAPGGWQGTSAGGSFYIRGVGTDSVLYSSPVGLYVDDVWISRQYGNGLLSSFPDIDRIEVLRGPQGTLYGQSSSGGAVKIVSRDPKSNDAWVQATGATGLGRGLSLYASHELVPQMLFGSIALSRYKDDGYTHNRTLDRKVDRTDSSVARAKLRFTPSDDLEAVLSVDWAVDHSDSPVFVARDYPGHGHDPRVTYENTSPRIDDTSNGVSLKVVKTLDEHLSLKSISAYRNLDQGNSPIPLDGVPTDVSGVGFKVHNQQRSQEFQLLGDYDRFNYVVGALALSENLHSNRPTWYEEDYNQQRADIHNENLGIYGQGTYKLTSKLGLTAGLRVGRDTQDYRARGYASNSSLQFLDQTYDSGQLHARNTFVTPKLGIEYAWSSQLFTYASMTKGQTAGGYSPTAATLPISRNLLDPEKVTTYELGVKNTFLGGRVSVNSTLFYSDYKQFHAVLNGITVDGVFIPGSTTVNAGKANIYGLEVDANARVTGNLDWSIWGALQHSRIQQFLNPLGKTDFEGNRLPNTPRFAGGTRINYKVPLQIPGELHANATLRFIANSYSDASNAPDTQIPSQTYVDAGTHYITPDGHWTLGLDAKNLLNRTYAVTTYSSPDISMYNPPRSVQASVRYDF